MSALFLEVEGPLRAWLRTQPDLLALLGNSRFIYFAAPDNDDRPDCWITLSRIGGSPILGDTPMDDAMIAINCWGRTKAKAAELAATVVNVIVGIKGRVVMDGVTAREGIVTGWVFRPDGETQLPRYVVDCGIYFHATP